MLWTDLRRIEPMTIDSHCQPQRIDPFQNTTHIISEPRLITPSQQFVPVNE